MPRTGQVEAEEGGGPRRPRAPKPTKRRGAGEGSCYFNAMKGLWVAEVRLGVGPDGKRIRKRVTSRSKAVVLRKLAVMNAAAARADSERETSTGAWLEAWLTNLAPTRRSANTLTNYRWAFEKWVMPTLGSVPLRSLGPADLERVWRLMAADGLSANSIKAAKSAVSAALTDAQRRGLVDRQAAQLSQVPYDAPKRSSQRRTAARAIQSLTQDEVDRLVATAREIGHPYEAMILIGATRGLRPGEWGWHGLTDIHHRVHSTGKDVHHGDHGAEQAP